MATAVESPGIVSAKEEAAAILFAREPQTPPVMSAPVSEQTVHVHEKTIRPTFAHYHEPETFPARPKAVDTTALRPYENFDEVAVTVEPQVVRPYIDSSDYLSSAVAATSVATPAPVTTVTEASKTVTAVESPLDQKLEEDTQYVVKFKNSTIVAMTIIATIFLLMSVLLVVNIVNLVTMSAEVNALVQESTTLEQTLSQEQAELNQAQAQAKANATQHTSVQHVARIENGHNVTETAPVNSSFFDWLCHSLSRLFS